MEIRFKYPRTYHLPWSLGATQDDKRLADTSVFLGKEVIVSEKLDGENCTMCTDSVYARSIDSGYHPSRTWVNNLWGSIRHKIPQGWRICGENVYARHSILYTGLTTYFYAFAVYDKNCCLGWDETAWVSEELGLQTVPVLYRGPWDIESVQACWTGKSVFGGEQEGYVTRIADAFLQESFSTSVAKYVRAGHVQTDDHWMRRAVVRNLLREEERANER